MSFWRRSPDPAGHSESQPDHQTLYSVVDKVLFWKNRSRPPESPKFRVLVPNPTFQLGVTSADGASGGGATGSSSIPNPNRAYKGNAIRTTKYTVFSFLPKNLFEQFHRVANLYFLFIVLLNWVPQINAFGKEIAMIPVIFVLGVTAIKDIFEDRQRYKSDKRINNYTSRLYSREAGRYVKKLWKDVMVGDLVHLSCNEIIPADILLLHSSDDQGLCYIETANIDGESNLKQRQVVRGFAGKHSFHPTEFRSTIECDEPNNKIYRFHGSIIHPNGVRVPINKENLLLRDCVVKNTDFVEGIVVYAGHETKAMLNNGGPRYKRSKLERRMNWDVMSCVIILVVLCFVGATGSGLWLSSFNNTRQVPFISFEDAAQYNPPYEGFLAFWTHVIILQVMIPLSMYVSIEIIKLGQVFHIHNDVEMYDEVSNKRIECRALNIPEELGQVKYIFSDKTGTLTENHMIFRRCTIGGVDYNHHHPSVSEWSDIHGNQAKDDHDTSSKEMAIDDRFILNSRLQRELAQMDMQLMIDSDTGKGCVYLSRQSQRIQDFFLLMAVCNTVVVSKYPHQDKMNSSGLYLDHSTTSSVSSSEHVPVDGNKKYFRLADGHSRSNNSQTGNTPHRKLKHLNIPTLRSTHSPVPSPSHELRPIYEAESPDELALVNAAYRYNCRLLKRMPESVTLVLPGEGIIEFPVLHVLPFDPTRKRMSVILEHPMSHAKILYCKGADSSVFSQLYPVNDEETCDLIMRTQQHLNNYAKRGLRILVMAKKVIPPAEYDEWVQEFKEAELTLDDRDQKLFEAACRIETNMELLGATGIEDRLQDGVPECIATLRKAGIVIWVLTGDKQETAVNIAYSCHLFSHDMEVITLNARSKQAAEMTVKFHLDQISRDIDTRPATPSTMSTDFGSFSDSIDERKRALVIDGRTLAYVLEKGLDKSFLELAEHCGAVLCCRATPLQKASIVKLVKDQLHVLTLAIGDGANDVSMIQTADVGIGISGQEGMQAVMASDFAMARFKHLERLLLVHGHWCYDRLARMILYFFYKNAGLIFIIFWYELYCGFSGMVVIEQLNVMLYNLTFTSLPPLILGIYDQDAPAELLLRKPHLYRQGRHSEVYKPQSFWVNMADALYQSLVIFFIANFAYHDSNVGIWELGTTITTALLFVQLLNLCIETKSWTYLHAVSFLLSIALYFGFNFMYNTICLTCFSLPNPFWVLLHCLTTPQYWLSNVLICVLAPLPRLVVRALQATLVPSDVTRAVLHTKLPTRNKTSSKEDYGVTWSSRNAGTASVFRIAEHSNADRVFPATRMTEVAT